MAQVPERAHQDSPVGSATPGPSAPRLARVAIVVGIAATLVIVVFGRMLLDPGPNTDRWVPDPPAPDGLEETVARFLAQSTCPTSAVAANGLLPVLRTAGYESWTVRVQSNVRPDSCVSATLDSIARQVVLIPGISRSANAGIDQLRELLMADCLNREQAEALINETLTGIGESGYEIRSDGPLAAPLSARDEVLRHVDRGCWVYSASGVDSDGMRIHFIFGK